MGSICFTVSETLRCAGYSREQSLFLLIPALVEGVVGLPLCYFKWGKGRMYWLWTLSGLTYTGLAVLDYFVHTHFTGPTDAMMFKIFDITIGASSFIPLLCYIGFLYLFSRSTLFPLLSEKWERIVSRTLLAMMPIIIAFNEISAFLGIRYGTIITNGHTGLAIGFATSNYGPWNIIANTTLALITLYQVVHFVFAFLHFFQKAYRGERVFSSVSERDIRLYSLKGTGWLAAGLKLGAIETVLGFAGYGFAVTFLRRILRVLGRAFLLVGVCISPDAPEGEGFQMFSGPRSMTQSTGRSLRDMISNPRTDTFRRLSANATNFYTMRNGEKPPAEGEHEGERRYSNRVTVRYNSARTPVLEMRFSDLDIRGAGLSYRSANSSVYSTKSTPPMQSISQSLSSGSNGNPRPSPPRSQSARVLSGASITSDSMEVVRALTAQFPMLPPRATTRGRASTLPNMPEADENVVAIEELQRKLSRRKPAPPPSPLPAFGSVPTLAHPERALRPIATSLAGRSESFVLVSPYIDDDTVDYEPPTPTSGNTSRASSFRDVRSQPTTTTRRTFDTQETTPVVSPRGESLYERDRKPFGRIAARAVELEHQAFPTEERRNPGLTIVTETSQRRRRSPQGVPHSVRYDSTEVLSIPWLQPEAAERLEQSTSRAPRPGVTRIKSFNTVKVNTTPEPRRAPGQQRESVGVSLRSPFSEYSDDEGAQVLMVPPRGSVDSGVLSADDRAAVRASMSRERGEAPVFADSPTI